MDVYLSIGLGWVFKIRRFSLGIEIQLEVVEVGCNLRFHICLS